jgi:hypothetical protein
MILIDVYQMFLVLIVRPYFLIFALTLSSSSSLEADELGANWRFYDCQYSMCLLWAAH